MKDFIKQKLNEALSETSMRFNDNGQFNKSGHNTIYLNNNPIVDFGVSGVGNVTVGDVNVKDSVYIIDYNASQQGKGWGTLGLKFIFDKLPKIQNITIQCYDTACPFWFKVGGIEIATKNIDGSKHPLRTVNINRDNFKDK